MRTLRHEYKLTKNGNRKVSIFLKKCNEMKNDLVKSGKDTAYDTVLPNVDDILDDITIFMDKDGNYLNSWGVTDNYNSTPLSLKGGEDFVL